MSDLVIQIPKRVLAKYVLNAGLWLASFLLVFLLDVAANADGNVAKLYGLVSLLCGLVALHYKVCRLLAVDMNCGDLLLVTIAWACFAALFGPVLGERMFESRFIVHLFLGVILLHFMGMLVFPIAPKLVIALNRWVDGMKL